MFLKKSLLFMTTLALLMFAGQASAKEVVSLTHVPGDGGTAGEVSGQGTEIVVEVSTTGDFLAIAFVYNKDLVTLTATDAGNILDTAVSALPNNLPNSFQVTFTTKADVTGQAFSIGIHEGSDATPPDAVMFNAGSAPPPSADGAALTVGGEVIVRGKSAGDEIVATISASTVTGSTVGAEFNIVGDKVTIKPNSVTGGWNTVTGTKDVTLVGTPKTLDSGVYGTITLMVADGVTADMAFSVGVSGFVAYNADGSRTDVAAGTPLMVNKPLPTLTPDKTGDVMIPRDGSATVTVTADGFSGDVTYTGASEDGTVSATEPAAVTVTATDGIDPHVPEVMVSFIATPIVTIWDGKDDATGATLTVSHGETKMVTAIVEDAVDGAEISFDVQGEGVMSEAGEGNVTVSATGDGSATITATVNGYTTEAVSITFVAAGPEAVADKNPVVVPRDGSVTVQVTTVGFPEDANVKFKVTAASGVVSSEESGTLTVTASRPSMVTVTATDGTQTTAPLVIDFQEPPPEVMASSMDAIIPTDETAMVDVTAVGFDADASVSFSISTEGTAKINTAFINDTTLQLSASGSGSAVVEVSASDGTMTTKSITITFWAFPTVAASNPSAMVPSSDVPSATETVTADGFPADAEVTFDVNVTEGSENDVTSSQDGNVLTLTATGSAVVEVTASDGTTTTAPVMVTFTQDLPAAPGSLTVQDLSEDNGFYVLATIANSEDHASLSQYRIYREMAVNDADGNPTMAMVPWAPVDAVPSDDGMTRAVIPVPDGTATRWGVAAERGADSSEITPAGKRVFSKESVQLLIQALGVDPNLIVSADELAQMFMPSADYIKSIIGDRKNVVFAALDPDVSVLMGGNVAIPQNIRTDGHVGGIVSSPITMTEDMVAAVDNIAPAAVTNVAADAETGVVTWDASADEKVVGTVDYRGYSIPILGVVGYKIMGGVSEDAMLDIGAVPAGSTTFQVPAELLQSLIDQGVPAVMVVVVAMDGTNMTPSMPLVVELTPTRKLFVDAAGDPVYIVKLERYGATTPLTVDFEDFIAFTMAFNTDESNENWREFIQADLNDDGMVNFDDFILFFSSYGKEAAGPAGKSLVTPVLGVNEAAEFSLRLGSDRVVAGETMFVDVSLANVQALMGYGFVLHYDAEKFAFVEALPATEDLLTSAGGETPLFKGWSDEAGQVRIMNSIVNGSEVSGGGDIVRLVFRVLRDFEDNARFEIAEGLVFDPSQLANPLTGGVLDIQTTPTEFALLQNFPNPFNPDTTIGYELAESADVTLQIYNVVGQVVRTLVAAEPQSVGRYQVRWDGMDDRGTPVSSGIYFYQISAGKFQDVRKLMLLK